MPPLHVLLLRRSCPQIVRDGDRPLTVVLLARGQSLRLAARDAAVFAYQRKLLASEAYGTATPFASRSAT